MDTEQKQPKPRIKLKADFRPAQEGGSRSTTKAKNEIAIGERVTIGRRDYEVTHINPTTSMVTLVTVEGEGKPFMQIQLTRRYLEEN